MSPGKAPGAQLYVPADRESLPELAQAASGCHGCELYENATQTVFGRGPVRAEAMLVGEQPGDVEDRRGLPFVGPAGGVLDRALAEAGIDRATTYVTNAVKHFRWKPSDYGARRLHAKPGMTHIVACRPWLAAELSTVEPSVVVALGATAATSLFGKDFRLTEQRGRELPWPPDDGPFADDVLPVRVALATIHPSAVLRADPAVRQESYDSLVADLRIVARAIG